MQRTAVIGGWRPLPYLKFAFIWSGKFNFYQGKVRGFLKLMSVSTMSFCDCCALSVLFQVRTVQCHCVLQSRSPSLLMLVLCFLWTARLITGTFSSLVAQTHPSGSTPCYRSAICVTWKTSSTLRCEKRGVVMSVFHSTRGFSGYEQPF